MTPTDDGKQKVNVYLKFADPSNNMSETTDSQPFSTNVLKNNNDKFPSIAKNV